MPIKINGTNTAANPSITGSDTDTGIVYGSDQIDFSTGGTSKVTLNGSDLGIGTSNPDRTIHCHNSSNTTNVRAKFSNGSTGDGASDGFEIGINASDPAQAVLVNYEASPMAFFTNATERLRIDGSGHLKFAGTTEEITLQTSDGSDNGYLNLSGGGACSQNRAAQVVMYGNEVTDQQGKLLLMAGNSGNANGVVGFYTGGSERMRITSAGDIRSPFVDNSTGLRQKIQFVTESPHFDEVGYIAMNRTAVSSAPSDMVFATGTAGSTSERMRINSSGSIGIGGTAPNYQLHATTNIAVGAHGFAQQLLLANNSIQSQVLGTGYTTLSLNALGGNVGIGCTATPSASVTGTAFIAESSGRRTGFMSSSSTSEMYLFQFFNPNGGVGSIRTNGSATSFQTSSDYRLKENAVAISDGITRLKTLKPYRFNFKADADTTLDGFFAHEVQSVVPEAISGTKDETKDILYTEDDTIPSGKKIGDVKEVQPVYQGIDQSKLVPLLTAALQETVGKIETLETKVAALEAA